MVEPYFLTSRPEVAAFLPPSFKRSLEIGCGAAGFSASHLARAEERWGIEPDPGAADIARGRLDRLIQGTYDQAEPSLPDGHFDLVICNDVIEHMPDHDAFLQAIKRKLAPEAWLVGSIPNVRHFTVLAKMLLLKDWPYREDGILDRTHLRFFTERSLRRSFTDNDFAIERLEGIRSIITGGVTGLSPVKNAFVRVAAASLVVLSLGTWSDTQYPQFAFRIRNAG